MKSSPATGRWIAGRSSLEWGWRRYPARLVPAWYGRWFGGYYDRRRTWRNHLVVHRALHPRIAGGYLRGADVKWSDRYNEREPMEPKLCTQCANSRNVGSSVVCNDKRNLEKSLVDGRERAVHTCEWLREDVMHCAPEGKWFIPREYKAPLKPTEQAAGK